MFLQTFSFAISAVNFAHFAGKKVHVKNAKGKTQRIPRWCVIKGRGKNAKTAKREGIAWLDPLMLIRFSSNYAETLCIGELPWEEINSNK